MKNAYKQFGYFYDEVMAGLDYQAWADFVTPYLKKGDKILDLACGTGTLLTILKFKGYECVGLDLSDSIIEIANEKKKVNRIDIPFYVGDMRDFKLGEKFNVITCFFDSVNFLKTKRDIDSMLNSVSHHLTDGGYFICDIFSKALMSEYENSVIDEDYETFKINWTTKKIDSNTLKHVIKIKDVDEEFNESYFEYYHEIKDLFHKDFNVIKLSGDFNSDLENDDERILIVMQKK